MITTKTTSTVRDYDFIDVLDQLKTTLQSVNNPEVTALGFSFDQAQHIYTVSITYNHEVVASGV